MQTKLLALRRENNETQSQLAKLLGLSVTSYSLKENGRVQFKSNEMFKLAHHFNKPIEDIFLPQKYTKRELNK